MQLKLHLLSFSHIENRKNKKRLGLDLLQHVFLSVGLGCVNHSTMVHAYSLPWGQFIYCLFAYCIGDRWTGWG